MGAKQSYSLGVAGGKAVVKADTTGGSYSATSAASVNDGSWHYVVASLAGSAMQVTVDGGVSASASISGSLQYASLPLEIGRFDSTAGQYFNGSLDEVAVYDSSSRRPGHTDCGSDLGRRNVHGHRGATGQTYTLTNADVGKQITFKVTATDSQSSGSATGSQLVSPSAQAVPTGPSNTFPPGISGTTASPAP